MALEFWSNTYNTDNTEYTENTENTENTESVFSLRFPKGVAEQTEIIALPRVAFCPNHCLTRSVWITFTMLGILLSFIQIFDPAMVRTQLVSQQGGDKYFYTLFYRYRYFAKLPINIHIIKNVLINIDIDMFQNVPIDIDIDTTYDNPSRSHLY